jgi:hypothetical protein
VSDVLKEGIQASTRARGPDVVFHNVDAPDLQRRRAMGILAGHPRRHLLVHEQIESGAHLIVQVAFNSTTMDNVAPKARDSRHQRHTEPPLHA